MTFAERVEELQKVLASRRAKDGGWPNKLHLENSPTTIVATAQVLEILRIKGSDHEDAAIRDGLLFLAKEVQAERHTRREDWVRYPAYALWGLMRYPSALRDPQIGYGASWSFDRLMRAGRPRGGWAHTHRHDQSEWLSLTVTMVAVHAMERFALYANRSRGDAGLNEVLKARDEIAKEAQRVRAQQVCWSQVPGADSCAGATCLAVLTLARGTPRHRQIAREGINWLRANPDLWTTKVNTDQQIDSRRWRILSFGLGVRSLLHPTAGGTVDDPALRDAVKHSYSLWKHDEGGWAEEPGYHATTSGSYAVVAAAHALKRAWAFDPGEHLGISPPRGRGSGSPRRPPPRVLYVSKPTKKVRVVSEREEREETLVEWRFQGRSQWPIVCTLAERHYEATQAGATDQNELTVSLAELAAVLTKKDGKKPKVESVKRTIKRINGSLSVAAKKWSRSAPFHDLIEDHVPAGTDMECAALEEIEVRFVDELPPE